MQLSGLFTPDLIEVTAPAGRIGSFSRCRLKHRAEVDTSTVGVFNALRR